MAIEHENARLIPGSAPWWRREYEDMVTMRNQAERERDAARDAARGLWLDLKATENCWEVNWTAEYPWLAETDGTG